MKNTLKKPLSLLIAVALILSGLIVPTQHAQAAKKLTKSDISKTTREGKINFFEESADFSCSYYYFYIGIDNDSKSNYIKTKRGIALNSTKKQVIKKYGKAKTKKVKVKTDNFYYALNQMGDDSEADLIKQLKHYVEYKYNTSGTEYKIRFYFDKNDKVKTIAYLKNYSNFKNVDWHQ